MSNGADVTATNSNGYSALILAVNFGNEEIVKLLIEAGADVNVKGKKNLQTNFYLCYYSHFHHQKIKQSLLKFEFQTGAAEMGGRGGQRLPPQFLPRLLIK